MNGDVCEIDLALIAGILTNGAHDRDLLRDTTGRGRNKNGDSDVDFENLYGRLMGLSVELVGFLSLIRGQWRRMRD